MSEPGDAGALKLQLECGSFTWFGYGKNAAIVCIHDLPGKAQTDSAAILECGKEGNEYEVHDISRDATAIVRYFDHDVLIFPVIPQ